ncbi:MAG: single-stranded-DNA-specific exonuclease RecJ [Pseudomonadales bacterium]
MNVIRRAVPEGASLPNSLPLVLQRVYASRGVLDDSQLNYQLKNLLSPATMLGISEAVERLLAALSMEEKILIVGDFDADGATSCAIGVRGLRAMGFPNVDFLVPNRFEYGYGLTPEIVDVATASSPDLILTVDNGIAANAGVSHANALGIDVVVTDHHLPGDELPDAAAIVNPNQRGCDFQSKSIAGVGVMFYLLLALRRELLSEAWFEQQNIPAPNLAELLDIVALGTVADVVSLDFNNRILVEQGLRRIRAGRACAGILALLEVAGRDHHHVTATDLGFVVGPRLNAAGRMEDMSIGIRCLLSDDLTEAKEIAAALDGLNRDRRSVETSMKREAEEMLASVDDKQDLANSICLFEPTWHQGVIGIVASRIKDRYYRPTIAFARSDSGFLKGSARSIKGLNIRDLIDEVSRKEPGLIGQFGGHAMAAGLNLEEANFERFAELLEQVVSQHADEETLQAKNYSDGELEHQEFSLEVAQALRFAGPWGQSYPEPIFDGVFELVQQRLVGEKHLKMVVSPRGAPDLLIDAIAFNVDLDCWPSPVPHKAKHQVRLLYKLDVNHFRGKQNVQLLVDELEAA